MADHLAGTQDQEASPLKASELAIAMLAQGQEAQLRAVGTSMLPFLWPGMLVKIAPMSDSRTLRVGDVAFVRCRGRVMLHRVIRTQPSIMTKGDAVPAFDPPIEAVYGRVIRQGGVMGWIIARLSRCLQPIQFGLMWLRRRF